MCMFKKLLVTKCCSFKDGSFDKEYYSLFQSIKIRINQRISSIRFRLSFWWLVKRGYMKPDGEPLMCHKCKCKHFVKGERFYNDVWGAQTEVEFVLNCAECGERVGLWSYGAWFL